MLLVLLLLLLGCAARGPAPAAAAPPPPTPVSVTVDYSGLFGGLTTQGIVDRDLVAPGLMDRVEVEAGALSVVGEGSGVVPWTRQVLLAELRRRGSLVLGPMEGARDGGPPTARLWGLRFAAGADTVPAVVKEGEAGLSVSIRAHAEEDSLCGGDAVVELQYVELLGTLQRALDGAFVAAWHEAAVMGPEDAAPRMLALSGPVAPGPACDRILAEVGHRELQPGVADQERAARQLLLLALSPLYPG